jgi:hypothetical protein
MKTETLSNNQHTAFRHVSLQDPKTKDEHSEEDIEIVSDAMPLLD